jgi:hypothetical protein
MVIFVLFHFPNWFIITGHGFYCFSSFFSGSSLLGMAYNVSFHPSLVLPDWELWVLFHFPHILRVCITGSSLLDKFNIVSWNASLVLPR